MKSDRTKSLIKKKRVTGLFYFGLWFLTGLFFIVYALVTICNNGHTGMKILTDEAINWLIGIGTTSAIALIGALIIKEKMVTLIWMLSLIIASVMFDNAGAIIVLVLWLIDEYIFKNLYHHYCHLVQINKEIDKR